MTKSTLTITPTSNIDPATYRLIDYTNVFRDVYHWGESVKVYDTVLGFENDVNVESVSVHRHQLVRAGTRYHIIHMRTTEEQVTQPTG